MILRGADRDSFSKGGNTPFPLTTRAGLRFGTVEHFARQNVTDYVHLVQLNRNPGVIPPAVERTQVK